MAPATPTRPAAPAATIGGSARILGLDLVRACAIALVMASHGADVFAAFWGARPPAFVSLAGVFGVELFFVLSGFLIGTLLARAAAEAPGWRGWRAFMLRRWLRTLPLYVAWTLLMAAAWPPADGRTAWHLLRTCAHLADGESGRAAGGGGGGTLEEGWAPP